MSDIEKRLKALGLDLAPAKPPVGNYLGCKQAGELLYASGRVSNITGKIGDEIREEEARKAAADTVLLILAIIKEDISDLDRLTGVIKVQGFMRCATDFTNLPAVLDGASGLLIDIFGEKGKHARTATGVHQLPFGASLQIDIIFRIRN